MFFDLLVLKLWLNADSAESSINCLFLKRREFCRHITTIHICVHVEGFTFETYAESDQELSPLVSCGEGLLKSDLDG